MGIESRDARAATVAPVSLVPKGSTAYRQYRFETESNINSLAKGEVRREREKTRSVGDEARRPRGHSPVDLGTNPKSGAG